MAVQVEEDYVSNEKDSFCNDLQDSIRGIQSIEEDMQDKQMLITFFDRDGLLRMSQFLKIMQAIMMNFAEEKNL